MTKKKMIAVLVAFAIVIGLVTPLSQVIIKADEGAAAVSEVTKTDVEGLETSKTATALSDGTYQIALSAYATEASLTPTPTDFELVLDMSGSMDDTLYTRDYKNLKNHVTWTAHSLADGIKHDDLYDSDNPDNDGKNWLSNLGLDSWTRSDTYKNNKFVADPNTPGTYVYLAQVFEYSGKTVGDKYNTYSYTITDSEGNVYTTESYILEYKLSLSVRSYELPSTLTFTLQNPDEATADAVEEFTIDTIYTAEAASYAGQVYTCADLYEIANNYGLYIIDDDGVKRQVFVETKQENTDDRITDYIFYITEDGTSSGTRIYETHQGNMVYGADYGVFQGFINLQKVVNSDGSVTYLTNSYGDHLVDHSTSIEHQTLYQGNTSEDVTNCLATQEALESFLINVHQDAADKGVDQRVGLISYGTNAKQNVSINDDESHIASEANLNTLIQEVYGLDADGATSIDRGMNLAYTEFESYSVPEGRNTVCLAFTDGSPTRNSGFQVSVADSAIQTSYNMKNNFGTQVYAVGLMNYADSSQLYGDTYYHFDWSGTGKNNVACTGQVGSSWGATWASTWNQDTDDDGPINAAACNRFLNYLSSNSTDATSLGLSKITKLFNSGFNITNNYNCEDNGKYFAISKRIFTGYDEDGNETYEEINGDVINEKLYSAFSAIADSIKVPSTTLDETTVVYDRLTDYFDFAEDPEITVTEIAADGTVTDITNQVTVNIDADTKSISVSGYDFADNLNNRLNITFKAKRADGFIGGEAVPTNTSDSGVYDAENLLEESFDIPSVDVPLEFTNSVSDESVYYSYEADLTELISTELMNGTNNAYVDAVFTIKDNSGNVVGVYTVSKGESLGTWSGIADTSDEGYADAVYPRIYSDTAYTVEYTVTSDANSLSGSGTANIYVWVPQITVTDGTTIYGSSEDITPAVEWVPSSGSDASTLPALDENIQPTVSLVVTDADTSTPIEDLDSHNFTADQNFQVESVQIGERQFAYYTASEEQMYSYEYDSEGNETSKTPMYDADGNPIMTTVYTEHVLDREAVADAKDASKFVNSADADDETPDEYEWTLARYNLVITKQYTGDYANPADTTFTVSGSTFPSETTEDKRTVTLSEDDFTGLTATADETQKISLYVGQSYTVTEETIDSTTADLYTMYYQLPDMQDKALASNSVFIINNTSTDITEYQVKVVNEYNTKYNPPATGNDNIDLSKMIQNICFILAGILGVYDAGFVAYNRFRNE